MRHLSPTRGALLSHEFGLLPLLPKAHRRKIGQHCHQTRIIFVKSFRSSVSHDENRATRVFGLPRKQNAICYQGRFDTDNFKKLLRDGEVLWVSAL